ncbi:MAG: hypothetical protein WC207_04740 [Sphaerochaetaceae bacterium]|jgi:hypothetical protein|nr:hypothetical protein [Sphaerochaetaceae bacterium]HHU88570.1 hypothetical protein [Spirochaetales bacterium]
MIKRKEEATAKIRRALKITLKTFLILRREKENCCPQKLPPIFDKRRTRLLLIG